MNMAVCHAADLSVDRVLQIIAKEKSKAVSRLDRPKGQEVYLVKTDEGKNSKFNERNFYSERTCFYPVSGLYECTYNKCAYDRPFRPLGH